MKKLLLSLFASGLLAGTASAALYSAVHLHDEFLGNGSSFTDVFDINADGYDKNTEEIYWAYATFTFSDDFLDDNGWSGETETVEVTFDSDFFGGLSSSGSWPFVLIPLSTIFGEVNLLGTLSDTGLLEYTVTAVQGDFYYLGGTLTAASRDRTASVPDGGVTAALIGSALLGLAAVRRRKA